MTPTRDEYWIVHDGQTIGSASEKILILFRCQAEDLIGRNIFEIVPVPEMRALARLRMDHIVKRGELPDQELPFKRFDGSTFWAKVKTYRLGLDTLLSTIEYLGEFNTRYHGT